MKKAMAWRIFALVIVLALAISACQPAAVQPTPTQPAAQEPTPEPGVPAEPTEPVAEPPAAEASVLGMLLVGPYNDRGWSQAHYEAGEYVTRNIEGTELIYLDKVNPADRPGTTPAQLGEDLKARGADLILFNSDDMKDSAAEFARANPDVWVIGASMDHNWQEGENYQNIPNMLNVMGRMEYGKAIAGCAAALTTQTGQIGYLGPLINEETRRLTASAYLGARYCWENYAQRDPADLRFRVTWIGFWFNIPGVTSDPSQVATEFFNSGFDVVISGIDTTEAIVEASRLAGAGQDVWAIPYDYEDACAVGPEVCLGVPYFNWGPVYTRYMQAVRDGTAQATFEWLGPDWNDINNHDTSIVGFNKGDALSADAATNVDAFIAELAGGLNIWAGPITLQDGTVYVEEGEVASDQEIWYLPQLLEGMEGQSVSQ
jgi:simple sugar transport system substrate-binding protein